MTRAEALLQRLTERVLLLDGGMGTLLIAMGLKSGQAPERWNLDHPDRIVRAHRGYVEAGSDIIHTNSFGGSPPKLASVGLEGRCREVNLAAARLARKACHSSTLVAGDIGPTGLSLPPLGTAFPSQLEDAFRQQSEVLAEGGVDLISIETMYDLREALAAVKGVCATGLPVLASMTFESRKRGFFTVMGDKLVSSLQSLREHGAHVVGFNCSVTSDVMIEMVREACGRLGGPIVVQPNAGQPQVTPTGIRYDASPADFTKHLLAMVGLGARIVGGCCGTDPTFIQSARRALDALDERG